MSINNRDDYDKLAKILYPSIEASGNVYFGQTRKLTMDEILGKNNLNFESHIESIQVEDNEKDFGYDYKSYFVWKLGPLYGSIRFNPTENGNYTFANFPDHIKFAIINEYEDEANFYYQYHIIPGPDEIPGYWYDEDEMAHFHFDYYTLLGTVFAKYEIHFDDISYNETISSGEYKSYAKSAYVEFKDLCITNRANPTNALDRNIGDRHFYIDIKDGHYYLYIQICTNTASTSYYFDTDSSTFEVKWDESFRDPLTLTAIEDSVTVKLISHGNAVAWYKYKLEGQDWENYTFEDPIQLNVGEYVKFKGDLQAVRDRDTDYVSFSVLGNGRVKASGDIRSMSAEHDQPFTSLYTTYSKLFYDVQKLVTAPKLPSSRLTNYNFYYTFYGCTNLQEAPKILASRFYEHCCDRMFYGCSQLNKVYPISAISLGIATNSKFIYMFNSYYVNELEFYFYDENRKDANISADFTSWLPETSHGTFTTNINPDNFGTFPENWTKVQIPFVSNKTVISSASANDIIDQDVIRYKQDKLFTSGANSKDNGRGDLTSKDTLFKMLEINPLYNGGVSFDTYNKDGSFNQEIWGLKSFNSPVMFRNGIYGECSSLTTATNNEKPNVFLSQSHDVTNFICSELKCSSDIIKSNDIQYNIYSSPDLGEFHPKSIVSTSHTNYVDNSYGSYELGSYMSQSTIASLLCDNDEMSTLTFLYSGTSEAPKHSAVIKTVSSAEDIDPRWGNITKNQIIYLTCKDDSNESLISINANSSGSSIRLATDITNIDSELHVYSNVEIDEDLDVSGYVNFYASVHFDDEFDISGDAEFMSDVIISSGSLKTGYIPSLTPSYKNDTFTFTLGSILFVYLEGSFSALAKRIPGSELLYSDITSIKCAGWDTSGVITKDVSNFKNNLDTTFKCKLLSEIGTTGGYALIMRTN